MAKVMHKRSISPEDMSKLYQSMVFDCEMPKSLPCKVFFDIMLFLCRGGQEKSSPTKDHFVLKVDGNG